MKKIKYFFIVLLIILLYTNVIEVNAMNTGFLTEKLPEQNISTFVSNVSISLLTEEPTQRGIQCFDVNENGMIAIGQESRDEMKEICIYSSDGLFQYGYSFKSSGSFGIEWDGGNINIYFVRSDIIVSINREGKIVDVAEVKNTIENNTYSNHLLHSTKRTSGDISYIIRNDMGIFNVFTSSYSQLIAIKSTGEEIILYNVNSTQFAKTIIICILAVIIFIIAVVAISWQFVMKQQNL